MSAIKRQKTGDELNGKLVVSTTSDLSMLELHSWLLSNKVVGLGLVDFRYSGTECGGSLGCFARERILEGDTIFKIPRSCIIGLNNANNTMLSNFIRKSVSKHNLPFQVTSELLIWLHMIEQRSIKNGDFEVYLRSLDINSPTLVTWNPVLLSALDNTNLGTSISDSRNSIHRHMDMLSSIRKADPLQSLLLIPQHIFNLDSLTWARGHYLARRYPGDFSYPCAPNVNDGREPGLENLGSLVPLLDILNHSDEQDWLRLEVEGDHLYVRCNHTVEKGAELYSNYGLLSNEKLLYAYGFATQDNAHDAIAVKLKVARTDAATSEGSSSSNSGGVSSSSSSSSNSTGNSSGDTVAVNMGVFYIESGGINGVPAELWSTLSRLGGEQEQEEQSDEEGGEAAQDTVEVGIEECVVLRDFLVLKRTQFEGVMNNARSILSQFNVHIADADGTTQSDSTTSATTSAADIRAVYIQWYLEGQQRILDETLVALNELIDSAEQEEDEDEEEGGEGGVSGEGETEEEGEDSEEDSDGEDDGY